MDIFIISVPIYPSLLLISFFYLNFETFVLLISLRMCTVCVLYASVRGNQDVVDTREKRPDGYARHMYTYVCVRTYGILSAAVDYRISER